MKFSILFRLFIMLGIFGLFAADDGGAGGGDDGDQGDGGDVGDRDINDDKGNPAGGDSGNGGGDDKGQGQDDGSEQIKTLQQQIKDLQDDKEARENKEALNRALSDLRTRHKGFDDAKVKDHLVKLHETDPQKAAMLNNPVGWENIWLNEFAERDVNNDDPSFGRNSGGVDRRAELNEKLASGMPLSLEDQMVYFSKR